MMVIFLIIPCYSVLLLKGGDTLAAIHALTHAVSASGSAAFEILQATTANICHHQLCSIFTVILIHALHSLPFSVVTDVA